MPTPLEEAQAQLEKVQQTLSDWRGKQAANGRELAELQDGHARAALDGVAPEHRAKQVAALEAELRTTDDVIASLETQRQAADRAVTEAQIADCRERAVALRKEAEEIAAAANQLRAQLEALEGPLYASQPRSLQFELQAQGLERQAQYLADQLWREDHPAHQRARPLHTAGRMMEQKR